MTPDDWWLAAVWPFVGGQLPSAPATVLEVGCGPLGGVVPALLDGGYDAVGVDPEAPEGSDYQQVELVQRCGGPGGSGAEYENLHHRSTVCRETPHGHHPNG
jgi:hypothetical protein